MSFGVFSVVPPWRGHRHTGLCQKERPLHVSGDPSVLHSGKRSCETEAGRRFCSPVFLRVPALVTVSVFRQVVILHHMLSKATVRARPSVLWCYKKELGFSR